MEHEHSSHAQGHSTSAQQVPSDIETTLPGDATEADQMLHLSVLHGGVTETFLFSFFSTSDDASFALACLLLVVMAFGLELMRLTLWRMEEAYLSEEGSTGAALTCSCEHCVVTQALISSSDDKNYSTITRDKDREQQREQDQQSESQTAQGKPSSRLKRWAWLVCVGVMQCEVYQVATLLMLVAMTMNIYTILALSAGSGLGRVVTLRLKQHYKERSKADHKSHHQTLTPSSSTSSSCPSPSSSVCYCCCRPLGK